MEFVKNEHKEYFLETYKFLKELDSFFYDGGAGHLFTEKELRKLKYAGEVDQINNYAYPVMKPTIDRIVGFATYYFLNDNAPIDLKLSNIINNKSFRRGFNKGNSEDRGAIEILKDNIKEYLENPTKLPKRFNKKKAPVKPGINQSRLKQPRVFTLKDKDELVRPNQATWDALCELEKAYLELKKANVVPNIDNQNPTQNYADRMHVTFFEDMEAYKEANVMLKRNDDSVRNIANDLVKRIKGYIEEQSTPFAAEVEHRKNLRKFSALKGNIKKASRKAPQIMEQLNLKGETLENRLTPTEEIVEKKGRSK